VDLVISDPGCPEQRDERRRMLAQRLKEEPWCGGLHAIESATVPVIKFEARVSELMPEEDLFDAPTTIPVDITFCTSLGGGCVAENVWEYSAIQSRDFVRSELDKLPLLRILVIVLKQMLLVHGLNDCGGYSGGLSSHSLCLLVVFYFQNLEGGRLLAVSWPCCCC
jgi:DNA polymerase sigma